MSILRSAGSARTLAAVADIPNSHFANVSARFIPALPSIILIKILRPVSRVIFSLRLPTVLQKPI